MAGKVCKDCRFYVSLHYSLRVHFFERILRANTVDMLRLDGIPPRPPRPPWSEASDPRLLLLRASDPDPRRPPPSSSLQRRPRAATGTRSSPLGLATNEKENMSRTHFTVQAAGCNCTKIGVLHPFDRELYWPRPRPRPSLSGVISLCGGPKLRLLFVCLGPLGQC